MQVTECINLRDTENSVLFSKPEIHDPTFTVIVSVSYLHGKALTECVRTSLSSIHHFPKLHIFCFGSLQLL